MMDAAEKFCAGARGASAVVAVGLRRFRGVGRAMGNTEASLGEELEPFCFSQENVGELGASIAKSSPSTTT